MCGIAGIYTTSRKDAPELAALALFAEHPDQWALLAEQPELVPRAVEESMRYLGAVRGTVRFAPEDIVFKTKPQIALDQIRVAQAEGVPDGVVLADAGYRINTAFRTALTKMGLTYVVGIQSSARLWSSGTGPLPPKTWTGQGRPPTLLRRDAQNKPMSAKQLAMSLLKNAWHEIA